MEKSLNNLPEEIRVRFGIKETDIRTYSPLALAFIGDGVYDLIIRSIVTEGGNRPAHELNKRKVSMVNAAVQSQMAETVLPILSQEEQDIYKKGRNAKSYTSAKNQSITDYRKATGLEALCGYLYLTGRMSRVLDIVEYGIEQKDRGKS